MLKGRTELSSGRRGFSIRDWRRDSASWILDPELNFPRFLRTYSISLPPPNLFQLKDYSHLRELCRCHSCKCPCLFFFRIDICSDIGASRRLGKRNKGIKKSSIHPQFLFFFKRKNGCLLTGCSPKLVSVQAWIRNRSGFEKRFGHFSSEECWCLHRW